MSNANKNEKNIKNKNGYFVILKKIFKNKKEIFLFFVNTFYFIFQKIYSFFYNNFTIIKNAKKDIKSAALNNYHLYRKMLKENKITDALFRIHLANFLRKDSAILTYHLAYIYFIKGNFIKCKKYLNKCLKKRPNFKHAQELLKKIT